MVDATPMDARVSDRAAEAAADVAADAVMDAATDALQDQDSAPPPCLRGDAGVSCFYGISEPASGYGAPYPVTRIVLTPAAPTETFTMTISTPPAPDYNMSWYDIDVSAFVHGGTLRINGTIGDGAAGCSGSTVLESQCQQFPMTGPIPEVEDQANVPPGGAWSFNDYMFAAGTTVLHLGSQGAWDSPAGSTNTNLVSVTVL